jgi:hypothetical protein
MGLWDQPNFNDIVNFIALQNQQKNKEKEMSANDEMRKMQELLFRKENFQPMTGRPKDPYQRGKDEAMYRSGQMGMGSPSMDRTQLNSLYSTNPFEAMKYASSYLNVPMQTIMDNMGKAIDREIEQYKGSPYSASATTVPDESRYAASSGWQNAVDKFKSLFNFGGIS